MINCHTHIFTADHVPPLLARTFVFWPFYLILRLDWIVYISRIWLRVPYRLKFHHRFQHLTKCIYLIKIRIRRSLLARILSTIVLGLLILSTFFIVYEWIACFLPPSKSIRDGLSSFKATLSDWHILIIPDSTFFKVFLITFIFLFYKPGRNLILFLLKNIWSFLGVLPDDQTKELAKRYLNIARFSFYKNQSGIFAKLQKQYPSGTGFVILPMDMEFMEAGRLKEGFRYHDQMAALVKIKKASKNKDLLFPFVFAEPRRMLAEGTRHFDYCVNNGQIVIKDCIIKMLIEENGFSGFKIYPALGYYPFDETLLALWKYAADNGLPVLSHCIRGTIFYRGSKDPEWDYHPIFEQPSSNGAGEPLLLNQVDNSDFINNFTHPLNFLCLLEEQFLRRIVGKAKDNRLRELFGYQNENTPLKYNLSHLKICLGHFGGDDEWAKFMESDRDQYSSQLGTNPDVGITFLVDSNNKPKPGKIEQLWKYTDWYSIICSLMLQYKHVYADLSYIIHNESITPLLKHTLRNHRLRPKVLFGTDFYVVRNHKSEKQMLADLFDGLSLSEIEAIGKINPRAFLSNKIHGDVKI